MSTNLDRIPAFMRDLADIAAQVMQDELELPHDRSASIAMRISRAVCTEHRGENIYIPAGLALDIQQRDQELHAAYVASGRDVRPVAKQFDLSEKQVYERVRLYEDTNYARNQGSLDLPDPVSD